MSDRVGIEVEGLRFRYDGMTDDVLRDVDLTVAPAAATAILGPNGCGKTTLLSLLLGLNAPQAGSIALAGRAHASYGRAEMSRLLGLVPQSEQFPLGFSVFDYVLLGRAPFLGLLQRPGDADLAATEAAILEVGIGGLMDRPVQELSGGERQLAMLARALAQQPRGLLMDEPASHLDLGNKQRVIDLIRAQVARGTTVLITTHDPNAAARVADHVVLMRAGQVVAAGPTAQALTGEHLTATYGTPVTVTRLDGRLIVYVA